MLTTIERILALKSVDLFSAIDPEEILPLAEVAQEVQFPAGTLFIRQGEWASCLYVVMAGETGVLLHGLGEVAVRPAPAVLGELSIMLRRPHSRDYVARTDISALQIDRAAFEDLLEVRPALALVVINALAARLDAAQAQLLAQRAS